MHVTWSWLKRTEGDVVPEDALVDYREEFFSELRDRVYEVGLLDLGGVVLADSLRYLIHSVCFKAVQSLRTGQPFVYQYTDADADVTFTPDGADVVVTGATEAPVRFKSADLLPALVACGERFQRFLADAAADDPGWSDEAAEIGKSAAAARAALAAPPPAA